MIIKNIKIIKITSNKDENYNSSDLKKILINYNQTKKLLNALFACIKSIFLSKEDILLKFKDNIFLNKT